MQTPLYEIICTQSWAGGQQVQTLTDQTTAEVDQFQNSLRAFPFTVTVIPWNGEDPGGSSRWRYEGRGIHVGTTYDIRRTA